MVGLQLSQYPLRKPVRLKLAKGMADRISGASTTVDA